MTLTSEFHVTIGTRMIYKGKVSIQSDEKRAKFLKSPLMIINHPPYYIKSNAQLTSNIFVYDSNVLRQVLTVAKNFRAEMALETEIMKKRINKVVGRIAQQSRQVIVNRNDPGWGVKFRLKTLTFNSPSNFLICLSILYISFCAFPRWLGILNNLKCCCLLRMVICGLNYVYSIIFVFVEESRVSQQYDIPFGWICNFCAVFTFHSYEILHYSLILNVF